MNIYQKASENIQIASFTWAECDRVVRALQCAESLAYGPKGVCDFNGHSYRSARVEIGIMKDDSSLLYKVSVRSKGLLVTVLDILAEYNRPGFRDYIVLEFHDGKWVEELEKLSADDEELQERKRAFLPLSQLALE